MLMRGDGVGRQRDYPLSGSLNVDFHALVDFGARWRVIEHVFHRHTAVVVVVVRKDHTEVGLPIAHGSEAGNTTILRRIRHDELSWEQ